MGLGPWAAWVAGMAYGLNPRMISQVGSPQRRGPADRRAPVGGAAGGARAHRPARPRGGRPCSRRRPSCSAAPSTATATGAGLPLVVILIVWGARRGLVRWSMLGWWCLFVGVSSFWWAASLLRLNAYSPPFFDYVEDARPPRRRRGTPPPCAGLSNWVNYIVHRQRAELAGRLRPRLRTWLVAGRRVCWPPSGSSGWCPFARPWRAPLLTSAADRPGLPHHRRTPPASRVRWRRASRTCSTAASRCCATSARRIRCCGCRSASGWAPPSRWLAACRRARRHARAHRLVVALVVPGVRRRPARDRDEHAHARVGRGARLLVAGGRLPRRRPGRAAGLAGAGFGFRPADLGLDDGRAVPGGRRRRPGSPGRRSRSRPPQTIRMLSTLERFLESGAGSPNLGAVSVGSGSATSWSATTSTRRPPTPRRRQPGVDRAGPVARGRDGWPTFGATRLRAGDRDLPGRPRATSRRPMQVRPLADAVTVASGVLRRHQRRRRGPDRAAGAGRGPGRQRLGPARRRRRRRLSATGSATSAGCTTARARCWPPGEPRHGGRVVPDYPANTASKPVRASYAGGASVTASSSQAWTNGFGRVAPEAAPYSAVDGDTETSWRSGVLPEAGGPVARAELADGTQTWRRCRSPRRSTTPGSRR